MSKWNKLPIMCWSLTLYKEDNKGNQKFYEYNGDHSFISEGIDAKMFLDNNKDIK